MAKYVVLLRNERSGAGWMLASGASGADAQVRAVEALGGRVLSQYATLGRYDVVLSVEFPDDAAAVAYELAVTASGQYGEMLPAFDAGVVEAARARAQAAFPPEEGEPVPT